MRDPALEWTELFADDMAVCLPGDHELVDEDEVALEQLADEAFAAPYECVCRDALVQACRASGFTPRVVTETNDYMAMQGLVASGVGVAVLPRLVASIAIRPEVALRPLVPGTLTRVVAVVSRRDGFRSQASASMQELLHRAARPSRRQACPSRRRYAWRRSQQRRRCNPGSPSRGRRVAANTRA
jgi:DNA-binding transcriptional LysR family regulator